MFAGLARGPMSSGRIPVPRSTPGWCFYRDATADAADIEMMHSD